MSSIPQLNSANLQAVASDWAANISFVVCSYLTGRFVQDDLFYVVLSGLLVLHASWQSIAATNHAALAKERLESWTDTLATRLGVQEMLEGRGVDQESIWNRAIERATNDIVQQSAASSVGDAMALFPKWIKIVSVTTFRIAMSSLIVGLPAYLSSSGVI